MAIPFLFCQSMIKILRQFHKAANLPAFEKMAKGETADYKPQTL